MNNPIQPIYLRFGTGRANITIGQVALRDNRRDLVIKLEDVRTLELQKDKLLIPCWSDANIPLGTEIASIFYNPESPGRVTFIPVYMEGGNPVARVYEQGLVRRIPLIPLIPFGKKVLQLTPSKFKYQQQVAPSTRKGFVRFISLGPYNTVKVLREQANETNTPYFQDLLDMGSIINL